MTILDSKYFFSNKFNYLHGFSIPKLFTDRPVVFFMRLGLRISFSVHSFSVVISKLTVNPSGPHFYVG